MILRINDDRQLTSISGVAGTQNENNATEILIDIPEKFNDFAKTIYFFQEDETPIGGAIVENNSYNITNAVTKYEKVLFCIKFIKNDIEWITELKPLKFNKNIKTDEDIPEEELSIIRDIIRILQEEIVKVKELETNLQELIEIMDVKIQEVNNLDLDIEKSNGTATVTLTKKDGTQKQVEILDGKDAKINGYNELEIIAGENIEINQQENRLEISAKDYDGELEELKQDVDNLDTEVERLTDNVNNIASDVSKIDEKLTTVASDVETNKSEIRELEENQNYLEENKADKDEIPDVSQFITKSVNDLVNYYKKTETYTQTEVNELIGAIKTISMKVLPERPTVGESNIIYLIPSTKTEPENIYDEWIYVSDKWEKIGTTEIDLSNYYTIEQINTILFDYITSNDLEEILTDYVKFTSYAKDGKAGVLSTGNNVATGSTGNVYAITDNYDVYKTKGNATFISKGTLENVIVGKELTDKTYVDEKTDELKERISELEEENKDLQNNQLIGTASGESITLNDSADMKFRQFNISGNSEQQTYEGYNLLINILETTNINGLDIIVNNDKSITINGTATKDTLLRVGSSENIKPLLVPGKNYYIKGCPAGGTNDTYVIGFNQYYNNSSHYSYDNGSGVAIKCTTNDTVVFTYYIIIKSEVTMSNLTFFPMIVEENKNEKPYEPYVGGQPSPTPEYPQEIKAVGDSGSINTVVQNKNFLKPELFKAISGRVSFNYLNNTLTITNISTGKGTYRCGDIFVENLIVGNKYTFSIGSFTDNSVSKVAAFGIVKSNGSYYGSAHKLTSTTSITFTAEETNVSVRLGYIDSVEQGTILTLTNMQLENGTASTSYTEHQQQTFTIPVQQPMLKGDYFDWDNEEEVHICNKIVLDGGENWSKQVSANGYYVFRTIIENISKIDTDKALSSHFVFNVNNVYNQTGEGFVLIPNTNQLRICIADNRIINYDINDFKNWLSKNNTELCYPLAEPKRLPFTDEQKEAAKLLKKARTYKNVTHIDTTDEIHANLDVEYNKDLKTVIDSIEGGDVDLSNYYTKPETREYVNEILLGVVGGEY